MHGINEEEAARVTEYILAGQKIEAIKLYNEATGAGLKASKDAIDDLEKQLRAGNPDSFNAALLPASISVPAMPEDDAMKMTEFIFAGQKIAAIKMYKEATGLGLKDSKEFIDHLEKQLRTECPEKFAHAAKAGCGAVVLLGGLLAALAAGALGWA